MSIDHHNDKTNSPEPADKDQQREYEKSGLYPENGKPFRIFALLGWLAAVVVLMAAAAATLNFMVI
jgi:hypothetical protein